MMYSHQKQNSIKRGHQLPKYTKAELTQWLFSQESFDKLYDIWVKSGYITTLKPSVDRIDDKKGYSFNNIQLMTWGDNCKKGRLLIKKPVLQLFNSSTSKEYESIAKAGLDTKIDPASISRACSGVQILAGGFNWRFK